MGITLLITAHLILSLCAFWTIWFLTTGGVATIIFVVIWPALLVLHIGYFIVGFCFLRLALKKSSAHSKKFRIFLGIMGSIPTLLLIFMLFVISATLITTSIIEQKQKTNLTEQQAQELIKTCKVQSLERRNDTNTTIAKLQLDKDKLNFFEKYFNSSPYAIQLPVDPSIYDNLVRIVRSQEVRNNCEHIYINYFHDPNQLELPSETKIIPLAELETLIKSCSVDELHLGTLPGELGIHDPTFGVPLYRVQEPTGSYTHAYTEDIPHEQREKLFELARIKQTECDPRRPIIVTP